MYKILSYIYAFTPTHIMIKQIRFLFLLCISFYSGILYAQRGKSGPLAVSSTVIVNEYTTLTANASVGNTSITVANSTLNSHSRFPGNLAAGDLIMIIQMQGATILSGVTDSTWGTITAYNNCGNYELREVLSVPNSTTINLTCPLINNYTDSGKVQIVRIPRYSTLTVNTGGVISCDAWGGQTGGILAIEVLGTTVINGSISADTAGFRGGKLSNTSCCFGTTDWASTTQNSGEKGEGIAGYLPEYNLYDGGFYCRGAPANGGGGGDGWNAGGGGGGNSGNIAGYNSNGNPDISNAAWVAAWNLEYPGFATNVSSGGGRGGYTYAVCGPNPYTVPPGNASWAGDSRRNMGGKGGRPLDYSTGRLFMGGGGGAGHEDNNSGSGGASGGGLVYLVTYSTINGTSGLGLISANGDTAKTAIQSYLGDPEDAPGGGGAGGTVIVNAVGSITGIGISANGGNGGNQYVGNNPLNECEGGGGGGGGGYIAVSNHGVPLSVLGGANGTTDAPGMAAFPSEGGTIGGIGDTASVTNFIIIAANDTLCYNTHATLTATLSGTVPGGTTIEWYDSITGGTMLGTGTTYITPALTTTTVYYVSTCPGDYRQADTVFVTVVNAGISPKNDSICKGDSIWLNASGGVTYKWSTSQTTDSIKISPATTTTYTLTAYKGGCSKDTTITVYVNPPLLPIVSAVPDTVCPSGTSILMVSGTGGQTTYKWSNGATYDTLHVNPSATSTYSVTVYGKCDTVKTTVTVHVAPPVAPIISGTPSKCKGLTDTLFVSGGSTYKWSNGNTSNTYITGPLDGDSTITVVDYNSIGCPDTAHYTITIAPSPSVTVTNPKSCLNNPVVITATASGTGPFTYSWSPGGQTNDSIIVPDTNQTYTVTVSNGCKSSKIITLVSDVPILNACCDKTILEGDDTVIVASGDSIKSYSWAPTVTCLNPPICNSVKVTPTVTTTYTVTGTDSHGCETERIVTIIVDAPCFNFTVPNVFTPDNAGTIGLNNLFYIKTTDLSSWSIFIYDRWGKEMFKTTNPLQYWAGTTEGGSQAPDGVYYYIITATCQGNNYKKDGFVQLIR